MKRGTLAAVLRSAFILLFLLGVLSTPAVDAYFTIPGASRVSRRTLNGKSATVKLSSSTAAKKRIQAVVSNKQPRRVECKDGTPVLDRSANVVGCNPTTIRHAALRIVQQSSTGVVVAAGSKNVELLRFEATAGRQDVLLSQLQFTAALGKLSSLSNYRLLAYTDTLRGAVVAHARPQQTTLAFTNMEFLLPDGIPAMFAVVADVPSSSSVAIGLGFAISQQNAVMGIGARDGRDVSGIALNNVCLLQSMCWVGLVTQAPAPITVSGTGNLYVSRDPSITAPRQVQLGTATVPLLGLRLRAEQEDVVLRSLHIPVAGGENVESLELLQQGSSTVLARLQQVGCLPGVFCANLNLVLQKERSMKLLVRAQMRSVEQGGTSGIPLQLVLSDTTVSTVVAEHVAVEAEGASSHAVLAQSDGDTAAEGEIFIGRDAPGAHTEIISAEHTVVTGRLARVESTYTNQEPLTTGSHDLLHLRLNAAPEPTRGRGSNVTLQELTFSVYAHNVVMDALSFVLRRADSHVTAPCNSNASTGLIIVTCSGLQSSTITPVLEPADSLDLLLSGTVTNAQLQSSTNSQIQANLSGITDPNTGSIVWTDGATSMTWVDQEEGTVRGELLR